MALPIYVVRADPCQLRSRLCEEGVRYNRYERNFHGGIASLGRASRLAHIASPLSVANFVTSLTSCVEMSMATFAACEGLLSHVCDRSGK
jgi:hypothetical protein